MAARDTRLEGLSSPYEPRDERSLEIIVEYCETIQGIRGDGVKATRQGEE